MKLLRRLSALSVVLFCQLPAAIALAEDSLIRIEAEHFSFRLNDHYRFIEAADTLRILSDAEVQEHNPLGMIVEKNFKPGSSPMGIVISATYEGHVEDKDAPSFHLKTGHETAYAVRILGRENAIHFHGIGDRDHIHSMQPAMQTLLKSAAFDSGYRYQDFNARYHRVAAASSSVMNEPRMKTAAAGTPIFLIAAIVGMLVALGRWMTRRRLPEF